METRPLYRLSEVLQECRDDALTQWKKQACPSWTWERAWTEEIIAVEINCRETAGGLVHVLLNVDCRRWSASEEFYWRVQREERGLYYIVGGSSL